MNQRRVLLAVTGGIAAYKAPELVRALTRAGCVVRCAMTPAAREFVTPLVLQTLSGERVATELFDLTQESEIGHIALADWAELLIVAPATANTLAKLAHGLADDPVSTLALATRAPILVAPAMNVNMWRHAATQQNLEILRARGVSCIGPDSGELACGWDGEGRMSDPLAIANAAALAFGTEGLAGEVVLVTAGGTREAVDAVRYLGNRSSGKMGFAIAREAARRGAEVILVAGPSAVETPPGVRRVDVESASEMRDAVFSELDRATIVVKAAAVADFRPAAAEQRKIKKENLPEGRGATLDLVQNADILAEVCRGKGERIVVGFAARQGAGFDADDNVVVFVWPAGEIEELPPMSKSDVAAQLLDRMEKLRAGKG